MKKNMWPWIVLAIVIVVVGAILIFHKSPKAKTPASTSTSQSTTTSKSSANVLQTKTASGIGQYYADPSGVALYTYSGDTNGVSNCSGSCIAAWPAYGPTSSTTAALPANITIISRSDGSKQYAYKGMPLYTFSGDSNGQVTGNGVSGFSVAKP